MAKLYSTENARHSTQMAVKLMGLAGYAGQGQVERMMRDARVTAIFEGTTEIQRIVIARTVLAAAGIGGG